jgi:hypothetical protein
MSGGLVGFLLNKVILENFVKFITLKEIITCSSLCKRMGVWRTKEDSDWPRILKIHDVVKEYFGNRIIFVHTLGETIEFANENFIRTENRPVSGLCFGKGCGSCTNYIRFAISNKSLCNQCFYNQNKKEFGSASTQKDIIYVEFRDILLGECIKAGGVYGIKLFEYWKPSETETNFDEFLIRISVSNGVGHIPRMVIHLPSARKCCAKIVEDIKKGLNF